jgi:hypothetical protein
LLVAGCRVDTRVTIDDSRGGHGTVSVSVSLDQSALAAIGGRSALAAQLQDADLIAAGWQITGPTSGPGATVVTASHVFSSPGQASGLIGELAGTGSAGHRPFQLTLATHHSFWRTSTSLAGRVDLTCGLDCFGDSGLEAATGSTTGVNPAPLEQTSGEKPSQVLGFTVEARLPGSVNHTNAATRQGGTARWAPQLGHSVELTASTEAWNWTRIITAAAIAGLVVLALLVLLGRWWWRRRRRGLHRKGAASKQEAVPSEA